MDVMRVHEVFSYDPVTGAITRRSSGRRAESKNDRGYLTVSLDGKNVRAHRVAFILHEGREPRGPIDHVNRDRANNSWGNLRESSPKLNQQNRADTANKHGFPGVAWFPANQKFGARIRHNGRRLYVGMFDTAAEASAAYEAKRRELFPLRHEG